MTKKADKRDAKAWWELRLDRRANAHRRIREAMREREKEVLAYVKEHEPYYPRICRSSWRHAIERLEIKGRIVYSRRKRGYVVA